VTRLDTIVHYLEQQLAHQRTRTFQEEYLASRKKQGRTFRRKMPVRGQSEDASLTRLTIDGPQRDAPIGPSFTLAFVLNQGRGEARPYLTLRCGPGLRPFRNSR
jgi:hypothetical protein